MTVKEKLETIRAEIFWRYYTLKLCNSSEAKYRREAYKELLDFINSLSEDVNEDLEEAADAYNEEYSKYLYGLNTAFKDGAKWQFENIEHKLLTEVLPYFMNGGEADEVVAKLEEVLNGF